MAKQTQLRKKKSIRVNTIRTIGAITSKEVEEANDLQRTRRPYQARLRMWYLSSVSGKNKLCIQNRSHAAYRFRIVETVKPRLSAARMRTRLFPMSRTTSDQKLSENGTHSQLSIRRDGPRRKKHDWIDSMLKYGNGYAVMGWKATFDDEEMTTEILQWMSRTTGYSF